MSPRRAKARNQAEKARRIADALEARGMLRPEPVEIPLDVDLVGGEIFTPPAADPNEVADRLAELPDVGRLMAAELAGEPAEVPSESTWAAVVAVVADRIALRAEAEALRVAVRQLEADLDNVAAERDAIRDAHDEIRRDYRELADENLAGELEQERTRRRALEADLADARTELARARDLLADARAELAPDVAGDLESPALGDLVEALGQTGAAMAEDLGVLCEVPEHEHSLAHGIGCRADLTAAAALAGDERVEAPPPPPEKPKRVRKSRAKPRPPVADDAADLAGALPPGLEGRPVADASADLAGALPPGLEGRPVADASAV